VSKTNRPRTLPIRGGRWKIKWVNNLGDNAGICDYVKKEIRIAKGQSRESELDTVVHEILHAALPDADEIAVHTTANAIAQALFRLGYIMP
jgi:hypothetical protein